MSSSIGIAIRHDKCELKPVLKKIAAQISVVRNILTWKNSKFKDFKTEKDNSVQSAFKVILQMICSQSQKYFLSHHSRVDFL